MKTHMRAKVANGEEGIKPDRLHHYCDKCGEKFVHAKTLRAHISRVHENIKFPCLSCSMTFGSKMQLIHHQRSVHSTDERFQCKHCPFRNGDLAKLRNHEQRHEDPQFKCKYCPKKLSTMQTLAWHERHHTGEKPFKCSMCESAFVSPRGIAQHMRGAHKIEGPQGGKTGWVHGSKKK